MSRNAPPPLNRPSPGIFAVMGPGIAVAATGVGAGDMIASTNAGVTFGTILLWTAVYGAVLKYVLTEGVARWQLATGTTLLEGWVQQMGRWIQYVFLIYLILWSFIVGGGLLSACGLAGNAIFPSVSVGAWGVIHSLFGAGLVLLGRYRVFEKVMKVFIGFMFVSFLFSAWALKPTFGDIMSGIAWPSLPSGSVTTVLSVLGGVGGSLTVLCYGYWIREAGREGAGWITGIRIDVGTAYVLTGFFAVAVMILGAQIKPDAANSANIVLAMADRLEVALGPLGRWSLYLGFWAAVITSVLGVWQGIPYLFADFMALVKRLSPEQRTELVQPHSPYYRAFLLFLTFPPMLLLLFDRPVAIVLLYTVVGALFMPFLAATLLYMNSKEKWVGALKNGRLTNSLLILALLLFLYLSITQIIRMMN